MNAKRLCQTAILAAFIFVITGFVRVPIPGGYVSFGNAAILLIALLLPRVPAVLSACLGSALADAMGFPLYILPTILIKGVMVFVFRAAGGQGKKSALAAILSTLIPIVGYTLTGFALYGVKAGLTQVPGLLIEYAVNLIVFLLLQKKIKGLREKI